MLEILEPVQVALGLGLFTLSYVFFLVSAGSGYFRITAARGLALVTLVLSGLFLGAEVFDGLSLFSEFSAGFGVLIPAALLAAIVGVIGAPWELLAGDWRHRLSHFISSISLGVVGAAIFGVYLSVGL